MAGSLPRLHLVLWALSIGLSVAVGYGLPGMNRRQACPEKTVAGKERPEEVERLSRNRGQALLRALRPGIPETQADDILGGNGLMMKETWRDVRWKTWFEVRVTAGIEDGKCFDFRLMQESQSANRRAGQSGANLRNGGR